MATATAAIIYGFFRSTAGIAILASVLGGMAVTFVWAEFWHWVLRRQFSEISKSDRVRWVARVMGILERGLLTTLVLWLPGAVGAFAGALIAVKAVAGWGDLRSEFLPGRARYYVSMMNGIVSIFWALACGIWGMPPQSN